MLTRAQRDFHLGLADLADELGRPPSIREAARALEVAPSTVVRLANRLRERGVVNPYDLGLARAPAPAPEELTITGEGLRALLAWRRRGRAGANGVRPAGHDDGGGA